MRTRGFLKSNLLVRDVNCKSIDEMLITIELLEGSSLKQHPKKHVMFIFKVTSIGCHNFTEKKKKKLPCMRCIIFSNIKLVNSS